MGCPFFINKDAQDIQDKNVILSEAKNLLPNRCNWNNSRVVPTALRPCRCEDVRRQPDNETI